MLQTKLKKNMKNKKGFTLIEVLAVIIILGILSAIAVPVVMNNIQESEAKAFRSDLEAVQVVANQIKPIATQIDYTKIGSKTALDESKIVALAQQGPLPKDPSVDISQSFMEITLERPVGSTTDPAWTAKVGTATLPKTLATQLGEIYGGNGLTSTKIKAYPLDVEVMYAAKMINNKLGYPRNISGLTVGYNTTTKVQNNTVTKAVTNPALGDETKSKPGYFFLLDNGRVMYTGTDARIDDDKVVHFSSSYVKQQ